MISTDVLVIGSGIAGLFCALTCAKRSPSTQIIIASKSALTESCSDRAQGGIACVTLKSDSFESHVNDTLGAGADLCCEPVVRSIVAQAPSRLAELIEWTGVHFTKNSEVEENGDDMLNLGKEGGHSQRRVLHCGDFTGHELVQALLQACRSQPNISMYERMMAVDLITETTSNQAPPTVLGAMFIQESANAVMRIHSVVTVLATGGCGALYNFTTNPSVATGDGIAMAWRAYAEIANMELIQFHPTCFCKAGCRPFLVSEALRGEGATLKVRRPDGTLEAFMRRFDDRGDLAPRDVVSRAITKVMREYGTSIVYLDITNCSETYLHKRFPNICAVLCANGVNPATDLIPVAPAAHFSCGGIRTGPHGETSVRCLYAVGECACNGMHGANRLASNSLLEGLVCPHEAVNHFLPLPPRQPEVLSASGSALDRVDPNEVDVLALNKNEVKELLWNFAGLVRTTKRLRRAKVRLEHMHDELEKFFGGLVAKETVEVRNMVTVAQLIVQSALGRQESRGVHYNADFPAMVSPPVITLIRKPIPEVPLWRLPVDTLSNSPLQNVAIFEPPTGSPLLAGPPVFYSPTMSPLLAGPPPSSPPVPLPLSSPQGRTTPPQPVKTSPSDTNVSVLDEKSGVLSRDAIKMSDMSVALSSHYLGQRESTEPPAFLTSSPSPSPSERAGR